MAGTNRTGSGLSQALSRWTVRFGGGKKDLSIDEFIFRVENLATADNINANSLVWGLHTLLFNSAADFYLVERRMNPDANWAQLKRSFLAHFSHHENDFEIRKIIMNRRQRQSEEFSEFCLGIECLAARLSRPMADHEIVDILRANMSPRLQDRLLLHNTATVASLKSACKRFEKMWSSQSEHNSRDNRMSGRLAALGFTNDCDPVANCTESRLSDGPIEELCNDYSNLGIMAPLNPSPSSNI